MRAWLRRSSICLTAAIALACVAVDTGGLGENGSTATDGTDDEVGTTDESGSSESDSSSDSTSESESESESESTAESESESTSESESESESTESESDSGETDSDDTGSPCLGNDMFEPNDEPQTAWTITWSLVTLNAVGATLEAYLCAEEFDWYFVDTDGVFFDTYVLHVDAIAAGSSWCEELCGDPSLPDAPENTIRVEVYDAGTHDLLLSEQDSSGRVDIEAVGEEFANDLLIRVYGPLAATELPYDLHVQIRDAPGDNNGCDC